MPFGLTLETTLFCKSLIKWAVRSFERVKLKRSPLLKVPLAYHHIEFSACPICPSEMQLYHNPNSYLHKEKLSTQKPHSLNTARNTISPPCAKL